MANILGVVDENAETQDKLNLKISFKRCLISLKEIISLC